MNVFDKAERLGVYSSFIDAIGQYRSVDAEAVATIAGLLPDRPQLRIFSVPVIHHGVDSSDADFLDDAHFPVSWEILDKDGQRHVHGMSHGHSLVTPELPLGIYRIRGTDANGGQEDIPLLVAPHRAFSGHFERTWILAVQLYGVKSSRNWGIGDFSDLKTLLAWAAENGAGGVGLNPLHALFDNHPQDCSPYSPNSRLFLNPLYLDVMRVNELPHSFAAEHAGQIQQLRSTEFVDYRLVTSLKLKALRQAFDLFKMEAEPARRTSFEAYRRRHGLLLRRFACFEVLRRTYEGPWWSWPEAWSSPNDSALAALRDGPDKDDIEFVEFVQWNSDQQLAECRDLATQLALPIGLYLDIAVGVKADGFDAWNEQAAISRRLAVGAPPDILNTAGQNWGLAGFNAAGLEERSFRPFMELLEASMRYAGAVRLDHVLGLKRIYLVPEGNTPDQGTYVDMPFEALLSVIALMSVRKSCVVIGEDLGTVPDGFRESLARSGIWSCRVMMFERDHDGSFHQPEQYPADALVTFNTHDLPTFRGWSTGYDIALKRSLGIDPGEDDDSRGQAVGSLKAAVNQIHLTETNFYATIEYLSRTPSRILAVSIEDLLDVQDQPNVPGTIDEHPNWRRKLPVDMEEWDSKIDKTLLLHATRDRATRRDTGN